MSNRFAVLTAGIVLLAAALLSARVRAQGHRFRIMEYNVENLYDTCRAAGHDDREFLPTSERRWNSWRYWRKLGQLCRTIAAVGGDAPVALVGLCEVENDSVLRDLTQRTLLRRLGYRYLVSHSRDVRGMNVALLYLPELFLPVSRDSLRIPYDSRRERPTRDILHVAGELQTGDTLDVFLCHLPSRRGGSSLTAGYWRRAARLLRSRVDSLAACRRRFSVVILGDFNDEPRDHSLRTELAATPPPADSARTDYGARRLYVLSARLKAAGGVAGTYKFRGRWNRLDQFIVNGPLLHPAAPLRTAEAHCRIFTAPFLIEADPTNGGVKLNRTYLGPAYHGGLSDHLPLVLDLWW